MADGRDHDAMRAEGPGHHAESAHRCRADNLHVSRRHHWHRRLCLPGYRVLLVRLWGHVSRSQGFSVTPSLFLVCTSSPTAIETCWLTHVPCRTIHICLFVDACFRRHREIKGRIAMLMYVPETGETVYVVAKSHSSREIPRVPARKLSVAPSRGVSSPPPSPGPPSRSRPQSPKTSPTAAHPPKPSDTDLLLAVLTSGRTDADASTPPATISPLASAVARKPLPPKPMPVDALHPPLGPGHEPPGPDYEPSTSELERRARGDAQPQMISPNDLALKFSASNTGMTPAPNQAKESKVLLDGMRLQRSNSF